MAANIQIVLRTDHGFFGACGIAGTVCALREVKEELDLVGTAVTLIGVYSFEQINQVIIAHHVPANGTVTLNHELHDFRNT